MSCTACGLSKPHKDKKKDCPAWSSLCTCGIKHHFHHICISDTQGCPQEATHKQEMEDYEAGSVEFNYNIERPDLEVVNKSVEVRTTAGVADAGFTVLSAVL